MEKKYKYYHKNHYVSIRDENKRTYYHFLSDYNVKNLEVELKNPSIKKILNSNRHLTSLSDIFHILVVEDYNQIVTQIIKEYNIPYIYVENYLEDIILPF